MKRSGYTEEDIEVIFNTYKVGDVCESWHEPLGEAAFEDALDAGEAPADALQRLGLQLKRQLSIVTRMDRELNLIVLAQLGDNGECEGYLHCHFFVGEAMGGMPEKAKISEAEAITLKRDLIIRNSIEDGMLNIFAKHFPDLDYNDLDGHPIHQDLLDMLHDIYAQNAIMEEHKGKVDMYWRDDFPWRDK